MNLRQLQYFIVLAEQKSFTAASNVLYISQPTLSQEIMKIEKEFGFSLFVRSSRSVQMTKEAEILLPEAKSIIGQVDAFTAHVLSLSQKQRYPEELTIGLDVGWDRFEYLGITDMVQKFRKDCSDTEIKLVPFHYPESFAQLESGYLDIAILFGSDELVDSLPCEHFIFAEEVLCLAVPTEILAANPDADITQVLANNTLLVLENDEDHVAHVNMVYKQYNIKPRVIEVQNMSLMLGYIGAGGGIGLIPNSYGQTLRTTNITVMHFKENAPKGKLVVLSGKRCKKKQVLEFIERLKNEHNPDRT